MRRLSAYFGKLIGQSDASQLTSVEDGTEEGEKGKPKKPMKATKMPKPHLKSGSKPKHGSGSKRHPSPSQAGSSTSADRQITATDSSIIGKPARVEGSGPEKKDKAVAVNSSSSSSGGGGGAQSQSQSQSSLASPQRIEVDPLRVSLLLQLLHHLVKVVVQQHISATSSSSSSLSEEGGIIREISAKVTSQSSPGEVADVNLRDELAAIILTGGGASANSNSNGNSNSHASDDSAPQLFELLSKTTKTGHHPPLVSASPSVMWSALVKVLSWRLPLLPPQPLLAISDLQITSENASGSGIKGASTKGIKAAGDANVLMIKVLIGTSNHTKQLLSGIMCALDVISHASLVNTRKTGPAARGSDGDGSGSDGAIAALVDSLCQPLFPAVFLQASSRAKRDSQSATPTQAIMMAALLEARHTSRLLLCQLCEASQYALSVQTALFARTSFKYCPEAGALLAGADDADVVEVSPLVRVSVLRCAVGLLEGIETQEKEKEKGRGGNSSSRVDSREKGISGISHSAESKDSSNRSMVEAVTKAGKCEYPQQEQKKSDAGAETAGGLSSARAEAKGSVLAVHTGADHGIDASKDGDTYTPQRISQTQRSQRDIEEGYRENNQIDQMDASAEATEADDRSVTGLSIDGVTPLRRQQSPRGKSGSTPTSSAASSFQSVLTAKPWTPSYPMSPTTAERAKLQSQQGASSITATRSDPLRLSQDPRHMEFKESFVYKHPPKHNKHNTHSPHSHKHKQGQGKDDDGAARNTSPARSTGAPRAVQVRPSVVKSVCVKIDNGNGDDDVSQGDGSTSKLEKFLSHGLRLTDEDLNPAAEAVIVEGAQSAAAATPSTPPSKAQKPRVDRVDVSPSIFDPSTTPVSAGNAHTKTVGKDAQSSNSIRTNSKSISPESSPKGLSPLQQAAQEVQREKEQSTRARRDSPPKSGLTAGTVSYLSYMDGLNLNSDSEDSPSPSLDVASASTAVEEQKKGEKEEEGEEEEGEEKEDEDGASEVDEPNLSGYRMWQQAQARKSEEVGSNEKKGKEEEEVDDEDDEVDEEDDDGAAMLPMRPSSSMSTAENSVYSSVVDDQADYDEEEDEYLHPIINSRLSQSASHGSHTSHASASKHYSQNPQNQKSMIPVDGHQGFPEDSDGGGGGGGEGFGEGEGESNNVPMRLSHNHLHSSLSPARGSLSLGETPTKQLSLMAAKRKARLEGKVPQIALNTAEGTINTTPQKGSNSASHIYKDGLSKLEGLGDSSSASSTSSSPRSTSSGDSGDGDSDHSSGYSSRGSLTSLALSPTSTGEPSPLMSTNTRHTHGMSTHEDGEAVSRLDVNGLSADQSIEESHESLHFDIDSFSKGLSLDPSGCSITPTRSAPEGSALQTEAGTDDVTGSGICNGNGNGIGIIGIGNNGKGFGGSTSSHSSPRGSVDASSLLQPPAPPSLGMFRDPQEDDVRIPDATDGEGGSTDEIAAETAAGGGDVVIEAREEGSLIINPDKGTGNGISSSFSVSGSSAVDADANANANIIELEKEEQVVKEVATAAAAKAKLTDGLPPRPIQQNVRASWEGRGESIIRSTSRASALHDVTKDALGLVHSSGMYSNDSVSSTKAEITKAFGRHHNNGNNGANVGSCEEEEYPPPSGSGGGWKQAGKRSSNSSNSRSGTSTTMTTVRVGNESVTSRGVLASAESIVAKTEKRREMLAKKAYYESISNESFAERLLREQREKKEKEEKENKNKDSKGAKGEGEETEQKIHQKQSSIPETKPKMDKAAEEENSLLPPPPVRREYPSPPPREGSGNSYSMVDKELLSKATSHHLSRLGELAEVRKQLRAQGKRLACRCCGLEESEDEFDVFEQGNEDDRQEIGMCLPCTQNPPKSKSKLDPKAKGSNSSNLPSNLPSKALKPHKPPKASPAGPKSDQATSAPGKPSKPSKPPKKPPTTVKPSLSLTSSGNGNGNGATRLPRTDAGISTSPNRGTGGTGMHIHVEGLDDDDGQRDRLLSNIAKADLQCGGRTFDRAAWGAGHIAGEDSDEDADMLIEEQDRLLSLIRRAKMATGDL